MFGEYYQGEMEKPFAVKVFRVTKLIVAIIFGVNKHVRHPIYRNTNNGDRPSPTAVEGFKNHHAAKSTFFSGQMACLDWENRKHSMTGADKQLRIYCAKAEDDSIIGYCIASITTSCQGEVESVYIKPDYRSKGVGAKFMEQSLDWFDSVGVTDVTISVAVGKEAALPFYAKFGFRPRTYNLKRVTE